MNNNFSTFDSKKINKLREVLNEAKGMPLNEEIFMKIDGICENIQFELDRKNYESKKTMRSLLLLQQLGEIMQGPINLDKLLHLILTCVTAGYAFGLNRAMLFLIDNENNVLSGKLAVGPSSPEEADQIWQEMANKYSSLLHILEEVDCSDILETPLNSMTNQMVFALSDTREIVVSCALEKKPIIVKDAINDLNVTEEFRMALGVNEFICVPLIARNEAIGVIVADNIYTGEYIDEDQVDILTMFANQAALAIEKAESHKRLEDKVRQLTVTQQKLIRSEKLAAIGSMAPYLAHEIRNPLVTIGGFTKSLSRFDFADPKVKTNLNIIIEEVSRLEKILNNITDFSKSSMPEKINVQICESVEDTCALMANYLQEKHINLNKEIDSFIPNIHVDPTQIKQVLLNILMNAAESMPEGGDITVNIKTYNKLVIIDIIDTGNGLSHESVKKMFDPFFTTKLNGTGLGMVISLKIINDHGGKINIESEPEKGTTVSLSLPIN